MSVVDNDQSAGISFRNFIILLVIFIAIGLGAFYTQDRYAISKTINQYIYIPVWNAVTDWDFLYRLLFLFGIVFVIFSDALMLPLAFKHYWNTRKFKDQDVKVWYPITILIPAYNEEVNLARTIESVHAAKYEGDKEIIVINDGSTDRTREIAEHYVDKGMIELINRENGGKTAAINAGLISARGEIIVIIDGDGIIEEDALEELIKKFQGRPEVGAVAGNIKVGNRVNFVTKVQHLEYLRDINIPRRAFNMLKTVMVIPGPLGAFRRSLLYTIGTYDKDTKTEDFDVTLKILKSRRGEIEVSETAIAWTEAPTTWRGLFKQRFRWYGGMFETLRKHKDAASFSFAKYGNLGRFGGWYTFVSLSLVPFFELFIFAGLLGILFRIIIGISVPFFPLVASFLSFIAIEMGLTFASLTMEGEKLHYGVWGPAFFFPYRQFLNMIKIWAFLKVYVLRESPKWVKVERKGLPPQETIGGA